MLDSSLYQAILARRSVRRYDRTRLDATTKERIEQIAATVQPLCANNRFVALLRDAAEGENLPEKLGAYGRIVTPPHYLVPYLVGNEGPLTDLGYRVEQIAVRLTELGLGSCYIGSVHREPAVRRLFDLPAEARIGAFLVLGRPSESAGGRAINSLLRTAAGATRRKAVDDIFFEGSFEHPATPPPLLALLLEAARHAPSAVHAQPWRFLWQQERLHLFVTRRNVKYGPFADYALYDGGICMGNVALALEALGRAGRWQLYRGDEPDMPPHPADLQPIAWLALP